MLTYKIQIASYLAVSCAAFPRTTYFIFFLSTCSRITAVWMCTILETNALLLNHA